MRTPDELSGCETTCSSPQPASIGRQWLCGRSGPVEPNVHFPARRPELHALGRHAPMSGKTLRTRTQRSGGSYPYPRARFISRQNVNGYLDGAEITKTRCRAGSSGSKRNSKSAAARRTWRGGRRVAAHAAIVTCRGASGSCAAVTARAARAGHAFAGQNSWLGLARSAPRRRAAAQGAARPMTKVLALHPDTIRKALSSRPALGCGSSHEPHRSPADDASGSEQESTSERD